MQILKKRVEKYANKQMHQLTVRQGCIFFRIYTPPLGGGMNLDELEGGKLKNGQVFSFFLILLTQEIIYLP